LSIFFPYPCVFSASAFLGQKKLFTLNYRPDASELKKPKKILRRVHNSTNAKTCFTKHCSPKGAGVTPKETMNHPAILINLVVEEPFAKA